MEDIQNGVQDMEVQATPAPQTADVNTDDAPMFGIDDNGDINFTDAFFGGGDDEYDAPDVAQEQPQEPAPQPQPVPQPEMQTVRVDGQDVQVSMDEMRNGYMRQADYTKKTQELAQQRQQLEAQRQAMMAQFANNPAPQSVQPQLTPEEQAQRAAEDQRKYLDQVDAYCKDRVQKIFGEDFDEYNSRHMAAYINEVGNVKAATMQRVNEMRQQEAQQNAAKQRIGEVTAKYQQDPNFDAINKLALDNLQNLPYRMYVEVQDALKSGNAQVIDNYMRAVSDMYYNRGNQQPQPVPQPQPRVQPPYVEPTNNRGYNQNPNRTMDYGVLGKMTNDQQAAYVSRFAKELGV